MKRGRHEAYATAVPNRVIRCSVDDGLLDFSFWGEPWGVCDICDRTYSLINYRQVSKAEIGNIAS